MSQIAEAYRSVGMRPHGEPMRDFAAAALRRDALGLDIGHSNGDPVVSTFNQKRDYDRQIDAATYWRLKGHGFAFMGPVDQNPKRDGLYQM